MYLQISKPTRKIRFKQVRLSVDTAEGTFDKLLGTHARVQGLFWNRNPSSAPQARTDTPADGTQYASKLLLVLTATVFPVSLWETFAKTVFGQKPISFLLLQVIDYDSGRTKLLRR